LAGAVVLISVFHVAGVLAPVENAARAALIPVFRGGAAVMTALGFHGIGRDAQQVQQQAREMEARLSSLSVDYVRLRALEEENRSLRDLGKFLQSSTYDHVGARVIARSTDPRDATFLIDRGSKDGLELGMAVVVNEGVFIGKITQLSSRVSQVMLVSDERSRVAATRSGEKKLLGVVEGRGSQLAHMTLIPQREPLDPHDIVVTAGTEEKIPPNLVIGVVDRVDSKPTDPFKVATLDPLSSRERIDLVIVLRPAALRPGSESGP